jgi:hypothetical protein
MEISIHELYRFLPKANQFEWKYFGQKLISSEAYSFSPNLFGLTFSSNVSYLSAGIIIQGSEDRFPPSPLTQALEIVENQITLNHRVPGSSPGAPTTQSPGLEPGWVPSHYSPEVRAFARLS